MSDSILNENNQNKKPSHVALIMDGNGRWAKMRGLPRHEGHKQGLKTLRKLLREVNDYEIDYLTLFSFSIDNWKRPKSETTKLMDLLRKFILNDLSELHKNNVRVRIIGSRENIPKSIINLIDSAEALTINNKGLYLQIAFNYSGRDEILNAVKNIGKSISGGIIDPIKINQEIFESYLFTSGVPDPDLVIRSGSERRISNFLLWQLSYAEVYFEECLWPDFDKGNLDNAIKDFMERSRRYGNVISGIN